MSTAEILSLISTISYVIAAISFALAVYFWFSFKIPSVIGDLSGRTAKKSIARMRAHNEKSGGQGYKPSAVNAKRGELTETMQQSKKLAGDSRRKLVDAKAAAPEAAMPETGLLAANKVTAVDEQQMGMLDGSQNTGLLVDPDATASLTTPFEQPVKRLGGKKLTMLDNVMLIHTDEVI